MASKNANIEDAHQEALIAWARTKKATSKYKVIDLLYAIPNGGKRGKLEAIRLKKQGVKAGVSDLNFPLPAHGKPGLWIEMKKPKVRGDKSPPKVSEAQAAWLTKMDDLGHATAVCFGWTEAVIIIENYLEGTL